MSADDLLGAYFSKSQQIEILLSGSDELRLLCRDFISNPPLTA